MSIALIVVIFFLNTYVFEEPLHEGEPEVIRNSTRVSSVDMFFITSRELFGFFTFAAVSQHCQSQRIMRIDHPDVYLNCRSYKLWTTNIAKIVCVNVGILGDGASYLRTLGGEPRGRWACPLWRVHSGHISRSHRKPQTPRLQWLPPPWLPRFQGILGGMMRW